MKLVAISDTGSFACQTDYTILSEAIAHRASWMPAEGVLFLLVKDDDHRQYEDVPAETLVAWQCRKEMLLKCCSL
jgi:hypothetical protein